ncbi:hypothetical protein BGZ51_009643 [Haplosporangium sp. Z 767]|nr:hypothetical protein BGZ50_005851 [Haplosporangium sp. Z 11]KAF9189410.1 hypothetical protein BGZ51_009643 [Haplosporangium sp. Z 767]
MYVDSFVGLASLILGIVALVKNDVYEKGTVEMKIWAGLDRGHAGFLPSVQISDTAGDVQGDHDSGSTWLAYNEMKTFPVKMRKNSEPKIIQIRALNAFTFQDFSCIAMIGWNPSNALPPVNEPAKRRGAIPGDVVSLCGGAWDYSGQEAHYTQLRCAWFGMRSHIQGTIRTLVINTDVISERNSPNLNGERDTFCYWGTGMESSQLSGPPRSADLRQARIEHNKDFGNRVRVHKSLSAIRLCDDPNSWGASFYSIDEGILCDMSTKTKIPVCKEGQAGQCFEYNKPSHMKYRDAGKRLISIRNQIDNSTYSSFTAEYFVTRDLNGTITDNGNYF